MAKTSKQTPLTVETFKELLMPEINKRFEGVHKELKKEIGSVRRDLTKLAHTVDDLKETVQETNEKVKYLPTTETYLASQDKLMKELKDSRDATDLTGQHYEDVTKRIEYIDKYLQIDSSLV